MTDIIANKEQTYVDEAPLGEGDHNFSTITDKSVQLLSLNLHQDGSLRSYFLFHYF